MVGAHLLLVLVADLALANTIQTRVASQVPERVKESSSAERYPIELTMEYQMARRSKC